MVLAVPLALKLFSVKTKEYRHLATNLKRKLSATLSGRKYKCFIGNPGVFALFLYAFWKIELPYFVS